MPELRVPKPNKSACGFWKRDAGWPRGACKIGRCQCVYWKGADDCGFGEVARALYARQEADRVR